MMNRRTVASSCRPWWLLVALLVSGPLGCGGDGGGSAAGQDAAPADAAVQEDAPTACSETDPRTVPLTVAVQPEDGEAPFLEVLEPAERTIRVMDYMLGSSEALTTLLSKAAEGKTVQVILDASQTSFNQSAYDQLTAAGAEVIWSDPQFTYMHAKTIVVDEHAAAISTGNFVASWVASERNFVVRDDDPEDVAALVALFDADFARAAPDLSCTRLVVSPVNSRERLLALINGAETSLDIESMQFADNDVRNAVDARQQAGVQVRVLLADPSWIDANTDAATFLNLRSIPVRYMSSPRVHVKAMVVDGVRAYAGSENLSFTSLSRNREVGVIITDSAAVQRMADTFETDWATATPF